jgi:hypothetical protein
MNRAVLSALFFCFQISYALPGLPADNLPLPLPAVAALDPDPMGGGGGGGQAENSAERGNAFSRFATGLTVSSLGIGAQAGTNLGPRLDLRLFGNYTNVTHDFTRSGFHISLNVGMVNAGAMADFYPLHRFPLRLSPGFLYYNGDRLAADLHAGKGATLTLNNVDYASDPSDPVHGTGRLTLDGGGFLLTAGLGHFVSHTRKRLSFPFEAGVAFINKPVAQFNVFGHVCDVNNPSFCEPAAQFPTFSQNLAAQVASWNRTVAPFHIYPVFGGGVSYSFSLRPRGVE